MGDTQNNGWTAWASTNGSIPVEAPAVANLTTPTRQPPGWSDDLTRVGPVTSGDDDGALPNDSRGGDDDRRFRRR
jgi:hypothetical protein